MTAGPLKFPAASCGECVRYRGSIVVLSVRISGNLQMKHTAIIPANRPVAGIGRHSWLLRADSILDP